MRKAKKTRRKFIIGGTVIIVGILAIFAYRAISLYLPHIANADNPTPSPSDSVWTNEMLQSELSKNNFNSQSIETMEGDSLKIILESGEEVYLTRAKSLSMQIDTLQKVQKRLTIENKTAQRIDVRPDNPIVGLK